jgi:hypothetical protein
MNWSLVTHIRCLITDLAIAFTRQWTQPRVATVHLPHKWPSFVISIIASIIAFVRDIEENRDKCAAFLSFFCCS